MKTKAVLSMLVIVLTLGIASAATASATALTYRTDAQAQKWLEHLKSWHGYKPDPIVGSFAFCINGYYSAHEKRTGKHFPQGKLNKAGEDLFHSFACTLGMGSHTFKLYLVAKPIGYTVTVDR